MAPMQMKEDASPFFRPSSPDRRLKFGLEDIPEAVPGPNAFALQAARVDRHRLEGNAFYQQEVQRRKVTPPTDLHPALRMTSFPASTSPPSRDSTCTTMTPFISACKSKENSPPLKLVPSDASIAEPTRRGCIEERREQVQHELSSEGEERTPVFVPTPKIASIDWAKPATPQKRTKKEASDYELPAKTPKRGFLERLKITTNFFGNSTPILPIATDAQEPSYESVPVKAQAVLGTSPSKGRTSFGTSPSKTNVGRSPSKRKGLFSRKNSSVVDHHDQFSNASLVHISPEGDHPPNTASTIQKTPQTAISDPTDYRSPNQRHVSHPQSDQGGEKDQSASKCTIVRSQSLKYFDHTVPPTPPEKNTPPDVKAMKEALLRKTSSRVPFIDPDSTPTNAATGVVSTSERISPTRFGSYGHREVPTLITKPSVYSLHASVVPNMTEASTFEEMKARIDGLGLEGFSTPAENVRSPKPDPVYSPSIYSNEWSSPQRPDTVVITPRLQPIARERHSPSSHMTSSSKGGGEIQIYYPELAKDPSVSDMTPLEQGKGASEDGYRQASKELNARTPRHGQTQSQDHSNSPTKSIGSSIFAKHIDNDLSQAYYESPTSFKHPSAAPSPLQFLPTTTYSRRPRISSKPELAIEPKWHRSETSLGHFNALGIQSINTTATGSPPRRNALFDNAPSLSASPNRSRTPSPQSGLKGAEFDDKVNVDPQKPSPEKSPSGVKLDLVIEMLDKIRTRNEDINAIRVEMRESNTRLDERVSAMETMKRRPSPLSSDGSEATSAGGDMALRPAKNRVSTEAAREFYRPGARHPAPKCAPSERSGSMENAEPESLEGLKATNKLLLERMNWFAEKIQVLEEEKKMKNMSK